MIKIGILGSHGSGKSTLTYLLGAQAKQIGMDAKIVNETARSCPFPLNNQMSIEACLWIYHTQIKKELEAVARGCEICLCDRTSIDSFLYVVSVLGIDVLSKIENDYISAFHWLKSYDTIIFVRNSLPVYADKYRPDDEDYSHKMQFAFSEFLDKIKEDINVLEVTSTDVFEDKIRLICTLDGISIINTTTSSL